MLWRCWNQKMTDWLTDWLTMSPIELSWTAKNVAQRCSHAREKIAMSEADTKNKIWESNVGWNRMVRQVWTSVNGGFGSSINYVNSNSGLSQRCWRHRRHNRSRQYTGLSITKTRPVTGISYFLITTPSLCHQCSAAWLCNWGGIIMNP